MGQFKTQLVESLIREGDGKLSNPENVAKSFVQEVEAEGRSLYSSNLPLYESFIKLSGVRLEQVTPQTTVGELGYLGIYNQKVNVILESLGIPKEREAELSPNEQIGWVIWKHMDKAMRNENRAHGSNIQDKHMGILALFVDVYTVDKRVHEYFRQLSQKEPNVFSRLGKVIKLSNYLELATICS
jgi:hypothetical protein